MDVRRAYCSAVDRSVPVVPRKGVPVRGRPARGRPARGRLEVSHPGALRCLHYPTRCTGWCCPLDAAVEARTAEAEASSPASGPLAGGGAAGSPVSPDPPK